MNCCRKNLGTMLMRSKKKNQKTSMAYIIESFPSTKWANQIDLSNTLIKEMQTICEGLKHVLYIWKRLDRNVKGRGLETSTAGEKCWKECCFLHSLSLVCCIPHSALSWCAFVCLFLYLLPTQYENTHFIYFFYYYVIIFFYYYYYYYLFISFPLQREDIWGTWGHFGSSSQLHRTVWEVKLGFKVELRGSLGWLG